MDDPLEWNAKKNVRELSGNDEKFSYSGSHGKLCRYSCQMYYLIVSELFRIVSLPQVVLNPNGAASVKSREGVLLLATEQ